MTTTNHHKELTFQIERETKGAVKYQELDPTSNEPFASYFDPRCSVGTLYIRKSALNGAIPKEIKVLLKL